MLSLKVYRIYSDHTVAMLSAQPGPQLSLALLDFWYPLSIIPTYLLFADRYAQKIPSQFLINKDCLRKTQHIKFHRILGIVSKCVCLFYLQKIDVVGSLFLCFTEHISLLNRYVLIVDEVRTKISLLVRVFFFFVLKFSVDAFASVSFFE